MLRHQWAALPLRDAQVRTYQGMILCASDVEQLLREPDVSAEDIVTESVQVFIPRDMWPDAELLQFEADGMRWPLGLTDCIARMPNGDFALLEPRCIHLNNTRVRDRRLQHAG
jgi:hypothetical protein